LNKSIVANKNCIPRLSWYRNALHHYERLGFIRIFSDYLADAVGVTAAQVRKDFSLFGISGNKRGGYQIDSLLEKLNDILGKNEQQRVILVGAGNLGSALLRYKNFEREGLQFAAAFDVDPAKHSPNDPVPILPVEQLEEFVKKNNVKIGVICVPEAAAQQAMDLMTRAGIKGILNFAPKQLKAPEECTVSNVTLEVELENLVYFVHAQERSKGRG
jgi:redox-sensing transcriptional repressor